jgi:DNA processing protein
VLSAQKITFDGRSAEGLGMTGSRYIPPTATGVIGLWRLLDGVRKIPATQQRRLQLPGEAENADGQPLYFAGDTNLVHGRCVAVVGSRKVSAEGAARARRLGRELADAGVIVVSGLAEGVDTAAHHGAIEAGGRTIAVIGTPLDKAFPAKNSRLQETIYREHLLLSPFSSGSRVFPSNFPLRNKFMAAITDATVIVEASDTSGALHQAAECQPSRLDRWLFIARSVVENPNLNWPKKFLGGPKVRVLESTKDILSIW